MAYNQIRGTGQGLQFLNFPFGDTTYTKVFVGGLAWETQSEMLHGYFEQFGEILEAVVITDKHTGRSKGYGFVTFRDPESAKRACEDPNPFIDGRRANCNLASLGRPQPSVPYGHIRSPPPYFGNPQARGPPYIRSPSYHHPVPYNYQTGFSYSPYGYPPYGPEYVYQQGLYNSYMSQNGAQMYGIQGGGINANAMLYGQNMSSFVMPPPPHIIQYGQPPVETTPSIQTPQNTGNPSSSSLHQSSDSD